MEFIEKQRQIESIVSKYDRKIIGEQARSLATEFGLQTSERNFEAIKQIEEEGRLLQIGIVGRVKAGKSSLINALLFDGKPVLPKAATPMTAALTIISYGKKLSAEVEFFSENDIENIRVEHDRYTNEEKKIFQEKYVQFKKRKLSKKKGLLGLAKSELSQEDDMECQKKAKKAARRELENNFALVSSFDQYEKIKSSGINVTSLKESCFELSTSNYSELSEKLLEYVAADSKYMPFTKSVHIKIPEKDLIDIQIVDTPGLNDPVRSREMRTRELLKLCDVVLIVSPAGQFLSNEDTNLMDRVTTKEGVRELFVVASQVDNSMFGDIKRDSEGDLCKALDLIVSQLSEHMHDTLLNLKNNSPEVGRTYDQLIDESKDKIIHSAGICQTLRSFWGERGEWDNAAQQAWDNLVRHYPDNFSDDNEVLSLESLKTLANTESVRNIFQSVRGKKEAILTRRKQEFVNAKMNSLRVYQKSLLDFVKRAYKELKVTDVDELRKQRSEFVKIREVASAHLNEDYFQLVDDLELELKDSLIKDLNRFYDKTAKDMDNAEETEIETHMVSDAPWWNIFNWKKHKEITTHVSVRTGAVRCAIEELISNIEDMVDVKAKKIIFDWKRAAPAKLISTLRQLVDDEYLEVYRIQQVIRKIFNKIVFPKISYSSQLPYSLSAAQGVLQNQSAENYMQASQRYVSELKAGVKKDIKNFVDAQLVVELKKINLPSEFFTDYDENLKDLESKLKEKEVTLDTYNRLLFELEGLN